MAKLTAWLVTVIGVLLLLPLLGVTLTYGGINYGSWLICLAVLAIGISKLIRNYRKR